MRRNIITRIRVFNDGSARVWSDDGHVNTSAGIVEFVNGYVHQTAPPLKSDKEVARDALRHLAENGAAADRIAAAQILLTCGGGE